ncbi:MAG: DUF5615 family PIN-like protein [Candidatus Xenobia bacterium]
MDVHIPKAITVGLRAVGIDVLTAQEDGSDEIDDPPLMDRAMELNRVIFTQDKDFLKHASQRQENGIPFNGVFYGPQIGVGIGTYIEDLTLLATLTEEAEMMNTVTYLPLLSRNWRYGV